LAAPLCPPVKADKAVAKGLCTPFASYCYFLKWCRSNIWAAITPKLHEIFCFIFSYRFR
jgi:hypothetical protein